MPPEVPEDMLPPPFRFPPPPEPPPEMSLPDGMQHPFIPNVGPRSPRYARGDIMGPLRLARRRLPTMRRERVNGTHHCRENEGKRPSRDSSRLRSMRRASATRSGTIQRRRFPQPPDPQFLNNVFLKPILEHDLTPSKAARTIVGQIPPRLIRPDPGPDRRRSFPSKAREA